MQAFIMKPFKKLIIFLYFTAICILATACSNSSSSESISTYDKLCSIYSKIVTQPIDLDTKEINITRTVSKELPNFFESDFKHIVLAVPGQRYALIKQVAESSIKKNWDCPVIKNYYATAFNDTESK